MANPKHLKILKQGVEIWNNWREENEYENGLDLSETNLTAMDLRNANLSNVNLSRVNLVKANLRNTNFQSAKLVDSIFLKADLSRADLSYSDLNNAMLKDATLYMANLFGAKLINTDFTGARIGQIAFAANDLSTAKGLESVNPVGPCSIGIDTLYKSCGNIPESFLNACDVPKDFTVYIPSHFGAQQAIEFNSSFISYSTRDEEFARRLYSRMRNENLRVWFAPEEMKGGEKLYDQIERAIHMHDKLLVVLSENSMQSEWVLTEIRNARRVELKESRRKLFPIRLVNMDRVREWKCFDADSGKDLAVEVREYFIPDFSNWEIESLFESAFGRLLRDLKAELS
jgi:uncharacterized protein YjbI with pentapeptide repeats